MNPATAEAWSRDSQHRADYFAELINKPRERWFGVFKDGRHSLTFGTKGALKHAYTGVKFAYIVHIMEKVK